MYVREGTIDPNIAYIIYVLVLQEGLKKFNVLRMFYAQIAHGPLVQAFF